MGYVPPDRDNVWYPRQAPSCRNRTDERPDGCVSFIALVSLCMACFWMGMWLGSRQPPPQPTAEANP